MPDTSATDPSLPTDPPEPAAAPHDDGRQQWTAVLRAAVGAGFADADADRPWQRLSCPDCGARLDLPPVDDAGWIGYALRACRRVAAYLYRHRPGGEHR
ncbi:MAG TPA: hypothetical protein VK453_04895 [Micromonosporaceae bacterium]|nr:hypothetical protein [Micromonosporaceae bacterium]